MPLVTPWPVAVHTETCVGDLNESNRFVEVEEWLGHIRKIIRSVDSRGSRSGMMPDILSSGRCGSEWSSPCSMDSQVLGSEVLSVQPADASAMLEAVGDRVEGRSGYVYSWKVLRP
jgi:hypothetical protein